MADESPKKAQLIRLEGTEERERYTVQFNPDSLKISFANQTQPPANAREPSNNNQGNAATQFIGRGTTKLSVTLWFDVTGELPDDVSDEKMRTDVRRLTEPIINFMKTQPAPREENQPVPPGVRFVWGSFTFDGLVESIEQSIEYFSPQGIPLRASLALSMTQQSIDYRYGETGGQGPLPGSAGGLPAGGRTGARPMTSAPSGASLQGLAAQQGQFDNWQAIAEANGIENPRRLAPGQLIDMSAGSATRSAGQLGGGLR